MLPFGISESSCSNLFKARKMLTYQKSCTENKGHLDFFNILDCCGVLGSCMQNYLFCYFCKSSSIKPCHSNVCFKKCYVL